MGLRPSKVDAIVLLEGQSGQQVAEVLHRDNKKIPLIAMDALAPTLDAIESGWITASVTQKPFTMGYFGLRMLADVELNKPPSLTADFVHDPNSRLPRFIDTGSAMVDQSNLAVYRAASK